jgi:hypothetical protein
VEDDAADALVVEELLSSADSGLFTVVTPTVSEAANRISRRTVCILLDLGIPTPPVSTRSGGSWLLWEESP